MSIELRVRGRGVVHVDIENLVVAGFTGYILPVQLVLVATRRVLRV